MGIKRWEPESKQWPRSWVISLQCGCTARLLQVDPPEVFDLRKCFKHDRTVEIVDVDTEYNVKCLDCSSRSYCGRALFQAQLFADKHHRKQPLHRIQLRKGTTVIEIRSPKINMDSLPFGVDNDEPPY